MSTRLRITGAFLAAVAVGLVVVGFVVHAALDGRLTDSLDETLETRSAALAAVLPASGPVPGDVGAAIDDPGEAFSQVLAGDGRVVAATSGLPDTPVVGGGELEEGETVDVTLRGIDVDGDEDEGDAFETDRARVLVTQAGRYTLLVGQTYEEHDEALRELRSVYLIAGPLALLLIGIAGFVAVSRALRPLRATMDQLERSLDHERRLVADVSHELRTPIAVISGELELAQGAPPEEAEESVRVAADEARRLGRMSEDLLTLARADDDRLDLRRERVAVRALLDGTKRRFATRGAEIRIDAPDDLAIDADRLRLEQALGNLVENALAHGGAPIELRARAEDGAVALAVRDHGSGFAADVLPRAFERFARAGARTGTGAGLGLAIVRVVAEAHGGTVVAADAEGGGAEVRILLPLS